ncbi:MAG TPA: hypothetical protein VIE88_17725 [Vicinamibacteria bacterium]|jgi:hypothetical protein
MPPSNRNSLPRLIFVPALISLGVTLIRLTGELLRWSEIWFSTATQGVVPSGLTWLIGITWLPIPFGAYFAWTLIGAGDGPPRSAVRSLAFAVAAAVVVVLGVLYRPPFPFPQVLLFIWASMIPAAVLAFWGRPALGRTLLAYGFASRLPVAVIMFLAMLGRWGTHYDYVGMPPEFQMGLWRGFFWLAFFPQLVFWVLFTVVLGTLAGAFTALLADLRLKSKPAFESR